MKGKLSRGILIYPDKATIPQMLLLWAIYGGFTLAGILVANGIVELMLERLLFALPLGRRSGSLMLYVATYGPIVMVCGFFVFVIWSMGPRHAGIRNLDDLKLTLCYSSTMLGLYLPNWLILYLFDDLESIAYAHCLAPVLWVFPLLYLGPDQIGKRNERRTQGFWILMGITLCGLAAYVATAQGWLTTTHYTGLKFGLGIDLIQLSPIIDPLLGFGLAVAVFALVNLLRSR